jgi:hypothetical protein
MAVQAVRAGRVGQKALWRTFAIRKIELDRQVHLEIVVRKDREANQADPAKFMSPSFRIPHSKPYSVFNNRNLMADHTDRCLCGAYQDWARMATGVAHWLNILLRGCARPNHQQPCHASEPRFAADSVLQRPRKYMCYEIYAKGHRR